MRRLITLMVCATLCTVAIAAPATTREASTAGMTQFQHDLVSVLALRADARPLLGAALLARMLPHSPRELSYHTLLNRAAAAPGAGPAITWAQLVDCDAAAMNCPNARAMAALEHQAADNAAVWLLVLGQATRNDQRAAARTALAKAADAAEYDDYRGVSLAALAQAVTALPPPATLYTGQQRAADSAVGVRALLVFGLANLQPMPGFHAAASLCAADKVDAATRATCLHLARTLVWAGAPLARSLGLHLVETLSPDADQRHAAADAWRDLVWQVRNFGRLILAARDDAQGASRLLRLARGGGTQMSLILAALRAAHIPVHAPVGWEPRASAAPSAPASVVAPATSASSH